MGELMHPSVVDLSPSKHPHLEDVLRTLRRATTRLLERKETASREGNGPGGGRWIVAAGYDDVLTPREVAPHSRDHGGGGGKPRVASSSWHQPTCDELEASVGSGVALVLWHASLHLLWGNREAFRRANLVGDDHSCAMFESQAFQILRDAMPEEVPTSSRVGG